MDKRASLIDSNNSNDSPMTLLTHFGGADASNYEAINAMNF